MNYDVRAVLYRVIPAVAALLVFYGLATEHEAALWVALVMAVLGNGVAAKHTPRR